MREIVLDFLKSGKKLTLLKNNKKIPLYQSWNKVPISKKELLLYCEKKGNIGWVLESDDLIVDVDIRNGGDKSFEKLQKDLDIQLFPSVITTSKGYHVYLSKDPKVFIKKNIRDYPGIDFLSKGHQCLIPGCTIDRKKYKWYDQDFGGFYQGEVPPKLLNLLRKREIKKDTVFDELDDVSTYSKDYVEGMLEAIDPTIDYDSWLRIGMALYSWNKIEGLEVWENWSKAGDNYEEGVTEKKWESFSGTGGITLGTLNRFSKIANFDNENKKVKTFQVKIEEASEKEIEFDIIPLIKKEQFNGLSVKKLAKSIEKRSKSISGVSLSVTEISKKLVKKTQDPNTLVVNDFKNLEEEVLDLGVDEWTKDWLYINSYNAFYNIKKNEFCKTESFNLANGKFLPYSEGGKKQPAVRYVMDKGLIKVLDTTAYMPDVEEHIANINGKLVLNTFNHKSTPQAASFYTEEGSSAIRKIEKHIKFICANNQNAHILTQWIASQIQFPGKQIRWSPVIHGIQGVGKSFFAELLAHCLGDQNVGKVSPKSILSTNNGWATGKIVNVIEEFRIKGGNRYEILNNLKPMITDRTIDITDKWVKQHTAYNTTNYICFTNYKDALPITGDDRRWWVISVPVSDIKELEEKLELETLTIEEYFTDLFNSMHREKRQVRKWLLEYPITNSFKNLSQAPMTSFKRRMIETEFEIQPGLAEIKSMISAGHPMWNDKIVCFHEIFEKLALTPGFNHEFKHNEKVQIMKKLGYMKLGNDRVKIKQKRYSIWSKDPDLEAYEVRHIIDTYDIWSEAEKKYEKDRKAHRKQVLFQKQKELIGENKNAFEKFQEMDLKEKTYEIEQKMKEIKDTIDF